MLPYVINWSTTLLSPSDITWRMCLKLVWTSLSFVRPFTFRVACFHSCEPLSSQLCLFILGARLHRTLENYSGPVSSCRRQCRDKSLKWRKTGKFWGRFGMARFQCVSLWLLKKSSLLNNQSHYTWVFTIFCWLVRCYEIENCFVVEHSHSEIRTMSSYDYRPALRPSAVEQLFYKIILSIVQFHHGPGIHSGTRSRKAFLVNLILTYHQRSCLLGSGRKNCSWLVTNDNVFVHNDKS